MAIEIKDVKRIELLKYVIKSHGNQKRKYTKEPYWTHPLEIADRLEHYGIYDFWLWEVAVLHDIVEDTDETYISVENKLRELGYGDDIIKFIIIDLDHVTDEFTPESYPDLSRKERKKLENERLRLITPTAKVIKCIDAVHNMESIIEFDKGFGKSIITEMEPMIFSMKNSFNDQAYLDFVKMFKICEKKVFDGITKIKNLEPNEFFIYNNHAYKFLYRTNTKSVLGEIYICENIKGKHTVFYHSHYLVQRIE